MGCVQVFSPLGGSAVSAHRAVRSGLFLAAAVQCIVGGRGAARSSDGLHVATVWRLDARLWAHHPRPNAGQRLDRRLARGNVRCRPHLRLSCQLFDSSPSATDYFVAPATRSQLLSFGVSCLRSPSFILLPDGRAPLLRSQSRDWHHRILVAC